MPDLRSAQQFRALDQARATLASGMAADRRRAEKIQRFFVEETVLALLSDEPLAARRTVQSVIAGQALKDVRLQRLISNAHLATAQTMEFAATGRELEEALLPPLHSLLRNGIDSAPGKYRTEPTRPILPGPPPMEAQFILKALQNTFRWVSSAGFQEIHPVEQTALLCARLLEIQPFAGGNLKTAQLLASVLLVRQGLPAVVFRREDQPNFLRALGLAFMLSMQDLVSTYLETLQRLLEQVERLKG